MEDAAHEDSVQYTLKELRRKIAEHEQQLTKLRRNHTETPLTPAAQARVITAALEDVTESEPFLPFAGSVLPSLIAMRKTYSIVQETEALVKKQDAQQDAETKRLDVDNAALKDQQLLTEALRARIKALQADLGANATMRADDALREKTEELQTKRKRYRSERVQLMKGLRAFINEQLAPLLAAEELGGPVVGDVAEIDVRDLASGFNAAGNLKRPVGKGMPGSDKRQRRIDDIYRPNRPSAREAVAGNEIDEAGNEMMALTEALLKQLDAAAGDNSESYVTIERESAASRFLIRSKIAQFHPKDAWRLRLIDFGRELDE